MDLLLDLSATKTQLTTTNDNITNLTDEKASVE